MHGRSGRKGKPARDETARKEKAARVKKNLRALLAPIVRGQRHFRRSHDIRDLEAIVPAWRRLLDHPALSAAPEQVRLHLFHEGGSFFFNRYHVRGEDDDLRLAVAVAQRARLAKFWSASSRPGRRSW